MERLKKQLHEASLSRIWKHMQEHATGTITAFRFARDCGTGEKYTRKENLQRNKSLLAKLQSKRYGVTSVRGSYIENFGTSNAREVGENVFFAVDLEDKGTLEKDLRKLGSEFDQDSILFVPKGGESAALTGTNRCPDGYPGFGKKINFNKRQWGKTGQFFTKVKGRPFLFEGALGEHVLPQGSHARWACKSLADKPWQELAEYL